MPDTGQAMGIVHILGSGQVKVLLRKLDSLQVIVDRMQACCRSSVGRVAVVAAGMRIAVRGSVRGHMDSGIGWGGSGDLPEDCH